MAISPTTATARIVRIIPLGSSFILSPHLLPRHSAGLVRRSSIMTYYSKEDKAREGSYAEVSQRTSGSGSGRSASRAAPRAQPARASRLDHSREDGDPQLGGRARPADRRRVGVASADGA